MNIFWGKGKFSFEEVRKESYLFANACFEIVKQFETDENNFDAIEIMNHAPKILRIVDALKDEADLEKFKSGIQTCKVEIQESILGLLVIFRNSNNRNEIEQVLKYAQNLQDIYTQLLHLNQEN
jgi:hypothetical protein